MCSLGGAPSGGGPEGGASIGVPRPWHATTDSGGFGNRSPGTTTRAARSWLHVLRRKWRGRKRGPEAENRHGWSAERRGVPIARDAGAPRKHRAPVGAPPPSSGGLDQSSGAIAP